LLTDIKHVFWTNPLRPTYEARNALQRAGASAAGAGAGSAGEASWIAGPEGVQWIGHAGTGFAFDNEGPRHRVYLEPFRIGARLVTNADYLEFVHDGGYGRAELWLSAGLATVKERHWEAPLYWERTDGGWTEFTLGGTRALSGDALNEPVCHVSYYEADAFARWAGARLPTEFEWEAAARDTSGMEDLYGEAWQWTQSAYVAYPNYRPTTGAIGEYNGKWMADQWVLRGSSLATAPTHARATYRNFFPSDARWQFTGIRLATGGAAAS